MNFPLVRSFRPQIFAAHAARSVLPNVPVRIAHLEPGLKLFVSLRRHLGLWWRGASAYEPGYVRVLREAAIAGDTVYDIGANIGFYSVLFSRWVGTEGCVIAFEPEPENLSLLRRNLAANRCENVQVRQVALGCTTGLADFSRDKVTGSTGHLGTTATYGQATLGDGRIHLMRVNVETIDGLLKDGMPGPDVIKLDIEGSEGDVLRGASRTLEVYRPVIATELSVWVLSDSEDEEKYIRPNMAAEELRRLEYDLWNLDTGERVGPTGTAWMVIAIPKEATGDGRSKRIIDALRLVA